MNVIEFKNASLWYGEVIALNEVSFKFEPGITGLVGSNGAGKTSSIKLAASLMRPTLGSVRIDGEDIWQNRPYLKRLGYSPEVDRQFSFLTGREFLKWSAKFHGLSHRKTKERVKIVLDQIGMSHAADREIRGYSRGMRQRIKVGQSLIHEPQVILADEPLAGTDPIGRNIIVDIFKKIVADQDITIVVSSHVLHELERVSDRVIVLESGKLVAEGKINEVRAALSKIPQKIRIRTNDSTRLAKELVELVKGLKIVDDNLIIAEVANRRTFAQKLSLLDIPDIDVFELSVLDEDLTSVFKLIKTKSKQN